MQHSSYKKTAATTTKHFSSSKNHDPKGTVATESHWQWVPTWDMQSFVSVFLSTKSLFLLNAMISGNVLRGPSILPPLTVPNPGLQMLAFKCETAGFSHYSSLQITKTNISFLPEAFLFFFQDLKHWVHNVLHHSTSQVHWQDLLRCSILNSSTTSASACSPTITPSFQAVYKLVIDCIDSLYRLAIL